MYVIYVLVWNVLIIIPFFLLVPIIHVGGILPRSNQFLSVYIAKNSGKRKEVLGNINDDSDDDEENDEQKSETGTEELRNPKRRGRPRKTKDSLLKEYATKTSLSILQWFHLSLDKCIVGKVEKKKVLSRYTLIAIAKSVRELIMHHSPYHTPLLKMLLTLPVVRACRNVKTIQPHGRSTEPLPTDEARDLHVEQHVDGDLAANLKNLVSEVHLDKPVLEVMKLYTEAYHIYAEHGFAICPPNNGKLFFTSKPIRILIATMPPHLVVSIVQNTNEYITDCTKGDQPTRAVKPLTIPEFFEYILVLVSTREYGFRSVSYYYALFEKKSLMSQARYDEITTYLQFSSHFIRAKSEKPTPDEQKESIVESCREISECYSSWIIRLFSEITCVTVDEDRVQYNQKSDTTLEGNHTSNYSPHKPSPFALQFYSVHEAWTRIALNLSPTIAEWSSWFSNDHEKDRESSLPSNVVRYLLDPLPDGDDTHQTMVVADGWYGSLDTMHRIREKNFHGVLKVNKNTELTPIRGLQGIHGSSQDYTRVDLTTSRGSGRNDTYHITASGKSKANVTLSSFHYRNTLAAHTVSLADTSTKVDVCISVPDSIYKSFANACDVSNSLVSHMGIHTLHDTRKFKTRLFHYFICLFVSQSRTVWNHLSTTLDSDFSPPSEVSAYLALLSSSCRHMLIAERHKLLRPGPGIRHDTLKHHFSNGSYLKVIKCVVNGGGANVTHPCHYAPKGKRHPRATLLCVRCSATNRRAKLVYLCGPCSKRHHSPEHFINNKSSCSA